MKRHCKVSVNEHKIKVEKHNKRNFFEERIEKFKRKLSNSKRSMWLLCHVDYFTYYNMQYVWVTEQNKTHMCCSHVIICTHMYICNRYLKAVIFFDSQIFAIFSESLGHFVFDLLLIKRVLDSFILKDVCLYLFLNYKKILAIMN